MAREYISVDSLTKEASQVVKMTNQNNEFNGTLKTTQDGEMKDVKEIFIQGATVNGEPAYIEDNDGKKILNIWVQGGGGGGTVKSVTLTGVNNDEGESITAYPDSNGDAKLVVDGLEVSEMWVDDLFLEGRNLKEMLPDPDSIRNIQPIDKDSGFTMEDLADRFNALLAAFKTTGDHS